MEALHQILSFHFLLRNSVYTSILIGFACPLVGVFLVLRPSQNPQRLQAAVSINHR